MIDRSLILLVKHKISISDIDLDQIKSDVVKLTHNVNLLGAAKDRL